MKSVTVIICLYGLYIFDLLNTFDQITRIKLFSNQTNLLGDSPLFVFGHKWRVAGFRTAGLTTLCQHCSES